MEHQSRRPGDARRSATPGDSVTSFSLFDEIHCEHVDSYPNFADALAEVARRCELPWDASPNRAPCRSWKTCGRKYQIREYASKTSSTLLGSCDICDVNSTGIAWHSGFTAATMALPLVTVDATFIPPDDGGRSTLPTFGGKPWYRPHIVIQDPNDQDPDDKAEDSRNEEYLGVQFLNGPSNAQFDTSMRYALCLMYHPHVDYSDVIEGATFTIREGARLVGFGEVVSRTTTTNGGNAAER